jgi:hypothetical protein
MTVHAYYSLQTWQSIIIRNITDTRLLSIMPQIVCCACHWYAENHTVLLTISEYWSYLIKHHVMQMYEGNRGLALSRKYTEVAGQHNTLAPLPQKINWMCALYRQLGGPLRHSRYYGKEKDLLPLPGIKPSYWFPIPLFYAITEPIHSMYISVWTWGWGNVGYSITCHFLSYSTDDKVHLLNHLHATFSSLRNSKANSELYPTMLHTSNYRYRNCSIRLVPFNGKVLSDYIPEFFYDTKFEILMAIWKLLSSEMYLSI